MAGHEEEDYMRDVDTHGAEGFVAGVPDLDDLEISDHEVTYRRADFSTNFLASRFDALDQAEFVTQGKASIQFAAVTHNVSELDDDDDDAIFSPALVSATSKPAVRPAAAASTTAVDENAMPTGEVPDARAVGFHCVNPSFESDAAPSEIFNVLLAALHKQSITTKTRADWTIEAFALVAAEEVSFRVQLHRLASRTVIRVDFNLSWGNEMLFLSTTDKIMNECRSIDKDMRNLPDLSFDFMMDWSEPHAELFPSKKATVNEAALQLLLDEIHSTTSHRETRYEAAKNLKDLCQLPRNRSAVAADYRDQFIRGLDAMLQDEDEDIVRFAIFAIQTFASDESLRATLEFPELSDKLRTISSSSKKSTTKKLADELLQAIVSPVS